VSADPGRAAGRFRLIAPDAATARAELAEAVVEGFSTRPKRLPARLLRDERTAPLEERARAQPAAQLDRAEREVLEGRAAEIAARAREVETVVELGGARARKARPLLRALLERRDRLRYVPIDASARALEASARALLRELPRLEIAAIADREERALRRLAALDGARPKLYLWLGAGPGEPARGDAARFLDDFRERLTGPDDRLIAGFERRRDPAAIAAAYDDPAGLNARLDLGVLVRLNRDLGARFDVARFERRALFDAPDGRLDFALVSRQAQRVRIAGLRLDVAFDAGEPIYLGSVHAYSVGEVESLAAGARLRADRIWLDERGLTCVALLAPPAGAPGSTRGPAPRAAPGVDATRPAPERGGAARP
jgi:uncharacterized SAM-dependent methyltransferase